jgi:SNF2 family DNA or RNA helicase
MDMQSSTFRISEKHNAILTPFDPRIKQVIPHAQVLAKNGNQYHLVPHSHTETKLLNNFGYPVPAPILTQYDWRGTKPFESQKATAKLMTMARRAYILSEMGTGKTRAALYAIDFLIQVGEINKVLIIAPLSTLSTVWEREIFECFPHLNAIVLHGTREQRKKALAIDADIYIINHDGVTVLSDTLLRMLKIDAIIVDELAVLRNRRTSRWKATNKLTTHCKYVWGMTGAPIPKDPTDAYGQVKLLTPANMTQSFTDFKDSVMYRITQFKWKPRTAANDIVYEAMSPHIRYLRKDCVDLPPTTYTTHNVALTAGQKVAYNDMFKKLQVQIATELLTHKVVAANTGVQLNKLLQISAGFVYGKKQGRDTIVAEYDIRPRLKLLNEIIDEASGKVIVFAQYKHSVEQVARHLGRNHYVEYIHGDVPKTKRDTIFNTFQHSKYPRVLVAHPGTMSHGLTLTAANTTVWYAPPFSLEYYEQANARTTRPGQNLHTHIIHIESTPAERGVYKTLQQRGNVMEALLDLFTKGGSSDSLL